MKNKLIKDTLILFVITIISGGLLGFFYHITKDPIKNEQIKLTQEAYRSVMSEAQSFKETKTLKEAIKDFPKQIKKNHKDFGKNGIEITKAFDGLDHDQHVGYVFNVITKDGYGGEIEMIIGINNQNQINGVEILTINETVGLGMNAKKEAFRSQFYNKEAKVFSVVKDGKKKEDEVDALSGATITSKAFTNAINGALYFNSLLGSDLNE